MTYRAKAILLLAAQCALVSSVAGKYLWERQTRPQVWTAAQYFDPELAVRGRYLALQPILDVCALPHDGRHMHKIVDYQRKGTSKEFWWRVRLRPVAGGLRPEDTGDPAPDFAIPYEVFQRNATRTETDTYVATQAADAPCSAGVVKVDMPYFVSEQYKASALADPHGFVHLYVQLTIPPSGPPRIIRLSETPPPGFAKP